MDDRSTKRKPRPFLGILFECCNAYARIYRRADGTAYAGGCPSCGRRIKVRVGSGGSDQRFFRAR